MKYINIRQDLPPVSLECKIKDIIRENKDTEPIKLYGVQGLTKTDLELTLIYLNSPDKKVIQPKGKVKELLISAGFMEE